MSARETILSTLRRSLGAGADDTVRAHEVAERLAEAPRGLIPARGQLPGRERVALFRKMVEEVNGTVAETADAAGVPEAVAGYLRERNLPASLVHGADPLIAGLPWETQKHIEHKTQKPDGSEAVGLSRASAGVAETGTLALFSGPDNPSTVNFLPEHHIVMIDAADIVAGYEGVWEKLRAVYGKGKMPRTMNFVTGPSRSADIEQTLLLGAHGPRALHVIIVGEARD
ncbi:MAG: lactate utilization protein C [Flavobacteriaceae bacterium]